MNKNFKNMTIGAVASVIAGAYYLYGSKEGEAKRKQIAAWSVKMKGEVLQGIEKLKEVSEPTYKEVVKRVSEKYKQVDKTELKKVVDELYSTWNKMKKDVATEIAKKQALIDKENKTKGGKAVAKPAVKGKAKTVAKPAAKKVAPKKAVAKAKPAPKSESASSEVQAPDVTQA